MHFGNCISAMIPGSDAELRCSYRDPSPAPFMSHALTVLNCHHTRYTRT